MIGQQHLEAYLPLLLDSYLLHWQGLAGLEQIFGNVPVADCDGDGILMNEDSFPNDGSESVDTDSDGTGNNADTDDDGDGVLDTADAFALIVLVLSQIPMVMVDLTIAIVLAKRWV